MYEIGDDMPLLGSEKDRLALVLNQDLLNMAKIGRASTPIDLMNYEPEDEQPSIFFLPEDQRQAILTVFNWTKVPRSHTLRLADLGLPRDHSFTATNVLDQANPVALVGGAVEIRNQPPESVRVIKIIDTNTREAAPQVTAEIPSTTSVGETMDLSAQANPAGVPAISYHWDFGDGTTADGPNTAHTYTNNAEFIIRLTVDGVDGMSAQETFPVKVSGRLKVLPVLNNNRRLVESSGR
jgi:hypothetical protein